MGLNRIWEDDAKTILRFEATGQWTWPEYDKFIDDMAAEIRGLGHVVHIIVVPGHLPPGSPIPHLQRVDKIIPDNIGKIVITSGNIFVRSINSAMAKIHPKFRKQLIFAADVNEARKMLKAHGVWQP